jgi:sugar phosphate isomerase/epimerase
MSKGIARRTFLQAAGMSALASVTSVHASQAQTENASVSGSSKKPRMFVGCCAYSYRKLLTSGQMTLEDFILKAVELRCVSVDMTVYYLRSTDPEYLTTLRRLAYNNAVVFSGAACGASMVQADAAKRADQLAQIKKWVDVTDLLGASHLRVFAGPLPKGVPLQQAIDWVVDTMKAACDYSANKGIILGLEDHYGVSQSGDVCVEIMQRVNSPYAGINLDITHFVPTADKDSYAQIAQCIPYAHVAHIRDRFDDNSPLDLERVCGLFAQAGFRGYLSVEYEGSPDGGETALTGVPRLVDALRTYCEKYSSV